MWRHLGCELVHYAELPTTPFQCHQAIGHKGILCRRTFAPSLLYHFFFRSRTPFSFLFNPRA